MVLDNKTYANIVANSQSSHYDHAENRYPLAHNRVSRHFVSGAVRSPVGKSRSVGISPVRGSDPVGNVYGQASSGTRDSQTSDSV